MLEIKTVTNGPIAEQLQCACHDTLPWLISFSLGDSRGFTQTERAQHVVRMVVHIRHLGHHRRDK